MDESLLKNTTTLGAHVEQAVTHYLIRQGLKCIDRNFRTRMGEIDLIMRDKTYLIFVEVRYKANESFSTALQSITRHKQQKILKTAQAYLAYHPNLRTLPCRLDAVCVSGPLNALKIEWIPNAFSM